jgi:hypothetical protein
MPNQPNPYDAVYGGPPISPQDGVVLGGLDGIRQQLNAPDEAVRVAALRKAREYGDAGLDLLFDVLKDLQKLRWETEEGKSSLSLLEELKRAMEFSAQIDAHIEIAAHAKAQMEMLKDDEILSQQIFDSLTPLQQMLAEW